MESKILKQFLLVKYLGITINEKLQWSEHVSNVTNKANSTLVFKTRRATAGCGRAPDLLELFPEKCVSVLPRVHNI